jgi:hypothetical protein
MADRYRVTAGLDIVEVDADQARMDWDMHHPDLRTGSREGVFILWARDGFGMRTAPVIYRPVTARTEARAA